MRKTYFLHLKRKHGADVQLKQKVNDLELIVFPVMTSKLTGSTTLARMMRELKGMLPLFYCELQQMT